jgi:hypothetical protein
VRLHPGLIEIADGEASIALEFGLLEGPSSGGAWSALPLRIAYQSGDTRIAVGLNGLSVLLRSGVQMGRPVRVESPRDRDLISIGGLVTVASRLDGDVWTLGADVDLAAQADVSGSIVAIGGSVTRAAGAKVSGSVVSLPEVKIPLLGGLAARFSVQALMLGRGALVYLLFGLALFLLAYFLPGHLRGLSDSIPSRWKAALASLGLAIVIVPAGILLLVVSVVGVFIIPVVAIFLAGLAIVGFLAVCVRFGASLRLAKAGSNAGAVSLFASGLLGLFLLKLPGLVGVFFSLLAVPAAVTAAEVLRIITLAAAAAAFLYGLGSSLAMARAAASRR